MMKELNGTDAITLLKNVRNASGNVWFITSEGDRLNLKSLLSQYIFLAIANDPEGRAFPRGEIVCDNEGDHAFLADFI